MGATRYIVTVAKVDRRYGVERILLQRTDGGSGWLKISGPHPIVQSAEVGQALLVTIEREDRPEPTPG